MTSHPGSPSAESASRLLSVFALLSAIIAATVLLFPDPLADAFFAAWVLFSVGLTLVGGVGAWTDRTPLVWLAAFSMLLLSVLGMWSIGFLIAPAALLLLGAALSSQVAGPREEIRRAIGGDPPTVTEVAWKTLAGSGSMLIGGGLVYIGAFTQELFGACANETVACALDRTRWGAVGITVLGLIAISFGGWAIWRQLYIVRMLASMRVE